MLSLYREQAMGPIKAPICCAPGGQACTLSLKMSPGRRPVARSLTPADGAMCFPSELLLQPFSPAEPASSGDSLSATGSRGVGLPKAASTTNHVSGTSGTLARITWWPKPFGTSCRQRSQVLSSVSLHAPILGSICQSRNAAYSIQYDCSSLQCSRKKIQASCKRQSI